MALAGKESVLQELHSELTDLQSKHHQLQESHAELGGSSDELQQVQILKSAPVLNLI